VSKIPFFATSLPEACSGDDSDFCVRQGRHVVVVKFGAESPTRNFTTIGAALGIWGQNKLKIYQFQPNFGM